jgi:outer membrane receptor protein involved in Fe transport
MASYTLSHSTIDAFDKRPELEGKYLTYVPKNTISASLFWKNKIVDVNIMGLYKSKQFLDDTNESEIAAYSTFDIQLSRQLFDNFHIMIDVQDIFDNRRMETIRDMSPGRIITGKLAFKF